MTHLKKILYLSLTLILFFSFSFVFLGSQVVVAQDPLPGSVEPPPGDVQSGCKNPPCLEDPLNAGGDVAGLIGKIIKTVLGIVGSIALVMFIYGGFMWMTAGGNTDRIKKGRDVLTWATIGLIIIFTSYAILTFIFGALR
jgi:hypothetical protein